MKVTLQHLTKKFPNRNKKAGGDVVAVNDFTFEIPDGKLIGLLGPSGCGKSTALNLISGLLEPTAGQIFFGEDDVTHLPPENRGVGLVFQNYALYPHLTVRQNIMFPLENLRGADKLTKAEMAERTLAAAKLVQLEGLMDRKPSELSGGQQQRVAIARAVFVTHDQEEAMSISDMIVVMRDGVVQQIGKPQEVYDNPVNLFVAKFLGTPPIHVFDGCIRDGKLYIGGAAVLDAAGAEEQPVYAAVRPEGFVPAEDGPLCCKLDRVEVMGRDISVVCTHPDCENAVIRAIITADSRVDTTRESIRFALKPHKVFLFHRDTQVRLDCTLR